MSRFLLSPLRRRAWLATAGLLARESPSLTAFPGIRPVADGRETRRLQLRGQPRLEPCSRFTREGTVAPAPWIAGAGGSSRTCAGPARLYGSRMLPALTLILGGARSGKSRHAEALATTLPPPWHYVATAQ